jgi:hypothetical protein
VKFNAMKLDASIPGEGAPPADGQYMQDDSGASMHMVDGKAWCVLGYTTTRLAFWLARQRVVNHPRSLTLCGVPIGFVVFEGQDAIGKILRIEYVGPSAVDFKGRCSRLLSRNGIEYVMKVTGSWTMKCSRRVGTSSFISRVLRLE